MRISRMILVATIALWQSPDVSSFEVATHSALSDRAVAGSTLDDFLVSQLGLTGGINESLSNGTTARTVRQWVQRGSIREDDGTRYFNHFHNPLENWNQAGI